MKTNIQELIQKNKDSFKKEFMVSIGDISLIEEMQEYNAKQTKDIIDAVIEDEEKSFQEAKSVREFMAKSGTGVGYNQAKQDTISKLKAIKELL